MYVVQVVARDESVMAFEKIERKGPKNTTHSQLEIRAL